SRSINFTPHPVRGVVPPRRVEALLAAEPFHLKEKPRQLFREARLPRFLSVQYMCFFRVPAEPGIGVDAELSPRAVHAGRFSQCQVDLRGVLCGGGSVRHRCGAKSRMLDSEIRPVAIPSGRRRRVSCAFSAAWPLCHHGIGDGIVFTNGCGLSPVGVRKKPRKKFFD
ncbi:hypothetical protein TcG_06026, partial [Trypanosoma cruzi]